jgi:DNA-binding CsgD family transcriptional regulator
MTLSPRQREVLRELLSGCCYDAVAARLGIATGTLKDHQHILYERLGVQSRAELQARLTTPTDEARRLIGDDA